MSRDPGDECNCSNCRTRRTYDHDDTRTFEHFDLNPQDDPFVEFDEFGFSRAAFGGYSLSFKDTVVEELLEAVERYLEHCGTRRDLIRLIEDLS